MNFLQRILPFLRDDWLLPTKFFPDSFNLTTPNDRVHIARLRQGTLPHSKHIRGRAFRYQSRQHVHNGNEFWKMFEDGPWRWDAKGRFAPPDISTGHYFAFTRRVALEEIAHYTGEETQQNHLLLQLDGEIDNILDLTSWDAILLMLKEINYIGDINAIDLMRELVHPQDGGRELTDTIGFVARRKGYNGIIFLSARAGIKFGEQFYESTSGYWDADMFLYEFGMMWRLVTNVCFVVFSGAKLLASIKRYRWPDEQWQTNPFYGVSEEVLDKYFKYGSDYQAERDQYSYIKYPPDQTASNPLKKDGN